MYNSIESAVAAVLALDWSGYDDPTSIEEKLRCVGVEPGLMNNVWVPGHGSVRKVWPLSGYSGPREQRIDLVAFLGRMSVSVPKRPHAGEQAHWCTAIWPLRRELCATAGTRSSYAVSPKERWVCWSDEEYFFSSAGHSVQLVQRICGSCTL